jgi:hypothetical protein
VTVALAIFGIGAALLSLIFFLSPVHEKIPADWFPVEGAEWICEWWGGAPRGNYMEVRVTHGGHRYECRAWDNGEFDVYDADNGAVPVDWAETEKMELDWIRGEAFRVKRLAEAEHRSGSGPWPGGGNPRVLIQIRKKAEHAH